MYGHFAKYLKKRIYAKIFSKKGTPTLIFFGKLSKIQIFCILFVKIRFVWQNMNFYVFICKNMIFCIVIVPVTLVTIFITIQKTVILQIKT